MTYMYSCHGAKSGSSRRLGVKSALPLALPLRFSDSSVRPRSTIRVRGSERLRATPPAPASLVSETKDG